MNIAFLQCTLCGEKYTRDSVRYVCPKHGDDASPAPLSTNIAGSALQQGAGEGQGVLDVIYDYDAINARTSPSLISESCDDSIWRYWELLPIEQRESIPPLQVGWTPLYHAQKLGAQLGLANLFIKDDGRNPTASLKDRASAVVVAKARELGVEIITTASSGNAGAALAAFAASAQMPAVIFVPESAPQAKVAQLLIFGATVMLVRGTYDDAFDLCLAASKEFGWYCRNTAYNPYTVEGKKTVAFEICEQLAPPPQPSPARGDASSRHFANRSPAEESRDDASGGGSKGGGWRAPDRIFVSVGDGNIISGVWKGLRDLHALGWIDRIPKLMGVQSEGSAACYNAWRAGVDEITPIDVHTIADSISVSLPRDGRRAVRAIRETNGAFITVSDEEILAAMRELARGAAVFAEPAGATSYAGVRAALRDKIIAPDETIVVIVTGNGLKDVASALKAVNGLLRETNKRMWLIDPRLDEVKKVIEGKKLDV